MFSIIEFIHISTIIFITLKKRSKRSLGSRIGAQSMVQSLAPTMTSK